MAIKYLKLNNKFLIKQEIEKEILENAKQETMQTNHIIVIDCSGSMYYDLPLIRTQLKNKLPNLVNIDDTVTIIYFSGRDEYGVLKERVLIKSADDIMQLNKAIDKWLTPKGLTGFKQPLMKVVELVNSIRAEHETFGERQLFNMMFITDGYDNVWREEEIVDQLRLLEDKLSSATFIEFGDYCNHKLLLKMTEACGGKLIYSKDFDSYDVTFDTEFNYDINSFKKIIDIEHNSTTNNTYFSYNKESGSVLSFTPNNDGELSIPNDLDYVCYLSDEKPSSSSLIEINETREDITYALLYILTLKMRSKDIYNLLENELTDSYLYELYKNCVGKQKYNNFQNEVLSALNNSDLRFRDGRKLNLSPSKVSLLDLIEYLKDFSVVTLSDFFRYRKIGRSKISKTGLLTNDERNLLSDLLSDNKTTTDKFLEVINEINNSKPKELKFLINDIDGDEEDFPKLKDIVYNIDRANLSFRVKVEGTVDLSILNDEQRKLLRENNVDTIFNTFIYRTYTIIKDGLLNIDKLPIYLPNRGDERRNSILSYLNDNKIKYEILESDAYYIGLNSFEVLIIDLNSLPIVKVSDIDDLSANTTFNNFIELQKLKARQKVYKFYENLHFPKTSIGYVEKFGQDATNLLKELGLTEASGFSPLTKSDEATDMYVATEVKIAAKGLSSLPKVDDVVTKLNEGKKLTISDKLMATPIQEYLSLIESSYYTNSSDEDKLIILKKFFDERTKDTIKETRYYNSLIAKDVFALVLSQSWFTEFVDDIDNSKLTINVEDTTVDVSASFKEVNVEI